MTNRIHFASLFVLTAASCAALVACGGGSSSDTTTTANSLTELQGSFELACEGYTDTTGVNLSYSSRLSVTVGDLVGTDRANVSVREHYYETPKGNTSGGVCADATLDTDITATGQIRDLGITKSYLDASGKAVSAKVVELTYSGFKLSKGSIDVTLPAFGTTAKTAYLLQGNKLFVSSGSREADGLPKSLHRRVAVKQ